MMTNTRRQELNAETSKLIVEAYNTVDGYNMAKSQYAISSPIYRAYSLKIETLTARILRMENRINK